jgi:hypothetical protein
MNKLSLISIVGTFALLPLSSISQAGNNIEDYSNVENNQSSPASSSYIYVSPYKEEKDWELKLDKRGVKIYVRRADNSELKEFKAETTFDALMRDINSYCDWIEHCKKVTVLDDAKFNEWYFRQEVKTPWPLKERDVIYRGSFEPQLDKNSDFVLYFKALDRDTPKPAGIRLTYSEGYLRVHPISEHQIKITWRQIADPAGNIPISLANMLITQNPYDTLNNIRERLNEDAYKNMRLVKNDLGDLVGLAGQAN